MLVCKYIALSYTQSQRKDTDKKKEVMAIDKAL